MRPAPWAEGPAEAPGLRPGLKEHSFRQELAVAREVPKVLASLQRLGVARAFWFNLMPVNEWNGSKAWGMLRRDYTIKAQYTAFATLTAQLGEAKIEGGLKLPGVRGAALPPGGRRAVAAGLVGERCEGASHTGENGPHRSGRSVRHAA